MPQGRAAAASSRGRQVRVFLGLTEICGYYANLRNGFHEVGVTAEFVALDDHPFAYGSQSSNRLIDWAKSAYRRRLSTHAQVVRLWRFAVEAVARAALLAWAVARFDVFIFGFGATFFRRRDLPLLKFFGKRIICVFHGSDERPPYLSGYVMTESGAPTTAACIRLTDAMKRRIRQIERYADVIVSHPLSAQLHERKIVPFLAVGVGYSLVPVPAPAPSRTNGTIRILHAPSRPEAKGTPRIRDAIRNLQAKGWSIDFVEIINRPNAEVLEELARCDLVVDEVWSDTPMAGLAAEAACFGKPAVVGGYGWSLLHQILPDNRYPPSHTCHPDELQSAIEHLVADSDYRRELGDRARRFVESHWSCRQVAETYLALIEGEFEEGWLYDPKSHPYFHGCGMTEERVRQTVREVVAEGGRAALQLADHPEWESAFMRFAGIEDP